MPKNRTTAGANRPATITRYRDFFPYYLQEHARPATRAIHYLGTGLTFGFLAAAILAGNAWWLLGMPLAGYFFAWVGHFGIEKNRPATFTYPLWSLASDYRMFFLWLTGRLGRHLKAAGVE